MFTQTKLLNSPVSNNETWMYRRPYGRTHKSGTQTGGMTRNNLRDARLSYAHTTGGGRFDNRNGPIQRSLSTYLRRLTQERLLHHFPNFLFRSSTQSRPFSRTPIGFERDQENRRPFWQGTPGIASLQDEKRMQSEIATDIRIEEKDKVVLKQLYNKYWIQKTRGNLTTFMDMYARLVAEKRGTDAMKATSTLDQGKFMKDQQKKGIDVFVDECILQKDDDLKEKAKKITKILMDKVHHLAFAHYTTESGLEEIKEAGHLLSFGYRREQAGRVPPSKTSHTAKIHKTYDYVFGFLEYMEDFMRLNTRFINEANQKGQVIDAEQDIKKARVIRIPLTNLIRAQVLIMLRDLNVDTPGKKLKVNTPPQFISFDAVGIEGGIRLLVENALYRYKLAIEKPAGSKGCLRAKEGMRQLDNAIEQEDARLILTNIYRYFTASQLMTPISINLNQKGVAVWEPDEGKTELEKDISHYPARRIPWHLTKGEVGWAPLQRYRHMGNRALQRMMEDDEGVRQRAETAQAAGEAPASTAAPGVNIIPNSPKAPAIGAVAYTLGNDIHFAPGAYNPGTGAGRSLLAHELGHVVQQSEGRVRPTTTVNGLAVNDNPALEREADRLGKQLL